MWRRRNRSSLLEKTALEQLTLGKSIHFISFIAIHDQVSVLYYDALFMLKKIFCRGWFTSDCWATVFSDIIYWRAAAHKRLKLTETAVSIWNRLTSEATVQLPLQMKSPTVIYYDAQLRIVCAPSCQWTHHCSTGANSYSVAFIRSVPYKNVQFKHAKPSATF